MAEAAIRYLRVLRGETLIRSTGYKGADKYISIECVVLLGLYFATRLSNLTLLPVFTDEATYVRFAQTMGQDLFAPLRIGASKFTHTWLAAVFLILPGGPLRSARWASVLAGGLSLLGVYLIGRQIYSRRVGTIAAILYLISPFALFHDRMLLADVTLNTCGIYTLLFSLLLIKRDCLADALGMGLSMGLGMLSKLPGAFFLSMPLITSLLVPKAHKGGLVKKLLLSYCFPVLMILPILLHPVRRERALSEIYWKTVATTSEGFTVSAWMELVKNNAVTALNDLKPYLTFPILLICGISFAITMYRRDKRGLLLSMLCFMPFLALVGSSKGFLPPRYFLFVVSPLLVLAAWGIVEIADRVVSLIDRRRNLSPYALGITHNVFLVVFLIALSTPSIGFDYAILSDPTQAPLPGIDRVQYIEGWPAGYSIPEVVTCIREQANDKKVEVITNSSLGIPGNALSMYFHDDLRVTIKRENLSKPLSWGKMREGGKIFVVLNIPRDNTDFAVLNPGAQLLGVYPKPGNSSWLELYELSAPPCGVSVSFDSAFYDIEAYSDHWWYWMRDDGQVSFTSPWKRFLKGDVYFTGWSFERERTLQIIQNGEPLAELIVPVEPAEFSLPDVTLKPGRNTFTFSTYPGAEVIDSILHNGDSRNVSIALSNVMLNRCRHTRLPSTAQPLEASFGDQVELLGYEISPEDGRIAPGGRLHVTLYWQSLVEIDRDYTAFAHLVDQTGRIYSQHDGQPAAGLYPTSKWKEREIIEDVHLIEVPADIPAGRYSLEIGMYLLSTMERLQISNGTIQADQLVLGSVEVLSGATGG